MPHDKIAELSGNRHAHAMKGSPIEHDPHAYSHMQHGEEKATEEVQHIVGMKR